MLNDNLISNEEYINAINSDITCIGNNPNNDVQNAPFFQDVVINELSKIPEVSQHLSKVSPELRNGIIILNFISFQILKSLVI